MKILAFRNVILFVAASLVCACATANPACSGKTSVTVGKKEYRLFNRKEIWSKAKASCKQWGEDWGSLPSSGRLVEILSEDLQQCLIKMMGPGSSPEVAKQNRNAGYFTGGFTDGSSWLWTSGERISLPGEAQFENWAAGEGKAAKSCLSTLMMGDKKRRLKQGEWVAQNCYRRQYFICQRDVADELLWGFTGNQHSVTPENWGREENFPACSGTRQSPADLSLTRALEGCETNQASTVRGWRSDGEVQWRIRNTGRMIEMRPVKAKSVYTMFEGDDKKHYVDYIHLKWGKNSYAGSEHRIGGISHSGELQIIHHATEQGAERQAVAFLLQQRTFQTNGNWSTLLRHISICQHVGRESIMTSPPGHIMNFLGDTYSSYLRLPEFIMGVGLRYRGSLTHPPCTEDVTWTVYPRPITLSFSQFLTLRHLHMEGKEITGGSRYMHGNVRPIQRHLDQSCFVTS